MAVDIHIDRKGSMNFGYEELQDLSSAFPPLCKSFLDFTAGNDLIKFAGARWMQRRRMRPMSSSRRLADMMMMNDRDDCWG